MGLIRGKYKQGCRMDRISQVTYIYNVATLTTHEVVDDGIYGAVEVAEPVGQLCDCHRDV